MMTVGDWILTVGLVIVGSIVLGLVLWGVFSVLPSPWPDRVGPDRREDSAEETLRQRFARGEIDAEEYEERRRVLNEQHRREQVPQ